jgi:hypothetical protein
MYRKRNIVLGHETSVEPHKKIWGLVEHTTRGNIKSTFLKSAGHIEHCRNTRYSRETHKIDTKTDGSTYFDTKCE